ncbi:MAG: CoA transferase [Betaproteobacteria bacterium]|nr:CoA transferase [Betaproteobacteria bacterium]MDC1433888.1 CoA transferase [Burkholderiales bacterium]MBT5670390.1 CoA transferase [Betaproteobacteria bacterium]MBT7426709.1 CoA transferase [Betaproteobacteria bacterium]MBT7997187.1 CoA transferase [Betaproteobacteria bacterium]
MAGPLKGVKILDLTSVVMGPFATQILAELGAEVTKVESLKGDNMRDVGPMANPHMGHLHLHLNRGKKGVAVDLKHPSGIEVIKKLIKRSDVLIYNVRPQAMARLGLSYEEVSALNSKIIYLGAYGYSEKGPRAGKAAYDDLIQGGTGVPWLVSKGGKETPRYVPLNFADRVTGLHAVYAVTSALYQREKSGRGQSIEIPMFETISHFVLGDHMAGLSFNPPIGPSGYERLKHRRVYETKNGFICALVYNEAQWTRFWSAMNQPEMMKDPKFISHPARAENIGEIYDLLSEIIKKDTTDHWLMFFESVDVPVARMNAVDDLMSDEHLRETGFFIDEEHPTEGSLYATKTPSNWSHSTPDRVTPAPTLGQHTREVLRELSYDEAEIDALMQSHAVSDGSS